MKEFCKKTPSPWLPEMKNRGDAWKEEWNKSSDMNHTGPKTTPSSTSSSNLCRVLMLLDSLYVTKRSRALNLHGHLLETRKKSAPNLWRKQTQIFWSRALARHASSSSSSSRTMYSCALLECVFSGDQGRTCQITNSRTVSSWMKSWGRASWMTVFFNPRWLLMAPSNQTPHFPIGTCIAFERNVTSMSGKDEDK